MEALKTQSVCKSGAPFDQEDIDYGYVNFKNGVSEEENWFDRNHEELLWKKWENSKKSQRGGRVETEPSPSSLAKLTESQGKVPENQGKQFSIDSLMEQSLLGYEQQATEKSPSGEPEDSLLIEGKEREEEQVGQQNWERAKNISAPKEESVEENEENMTTNEQLRESPKEEKQEQYTLISAVTDLAKSYDELSNVSPPGQESHLGVEPGGGEGPVQRILEDRPHPHLPQPHLSHTPLPAVLSPLIERSDPSTPISKPPAIEPQRGEMEVGEERKEKGTARSFPNLREGEGSGTGPSPPRRQSVGSCMSDRSSPKKKSVSFSDLKQTGLTTTVNCFIDVGWGNQLFIRGEGCGLSWQKGQKLRNISADQWQWQNQQIFIEKEPSSQDSNSRDKEEENVGKGGGGGGREMFPDGISDTESADYSVMIEDIELPPLSQSLSEALVSDIRSNHVFRMEDSDPLDQDEGGSSLNSSRRASLSEANALNLLRNVSAEVIFGSEKQPIPFEFKVLINDRIYEEGPNHQMMVGDSINYQPHFRRK